jgi:hypothetical protein
VEYAAFKLTAPNALFFGPTNLGGAGWRSPARGPILQAAGEVLDCLAVGTDASQAQTDFIATWAGDHPVHIWEGTTGNADSGRFRTTMEAATWAVSTQAARGAIYAADVSHLLTRKGAATGTYPYVGLTWWQFVDNFAEGANWGVVSLRDNAYDGVEAKIAAGTDSGGYTTGGEEANYGDFMTSAITAHAAVEATLIANT